MRPTQAPDTHRGSPRWDDPPLIDLLALAFRSFSSHRPSCPEARRAMSRCEPGVPVARPRCPQVTSPSPRPGCPSRRSGAMGDPLPTASWGGPRCVASGPCSRRSRLPGGPVELGPGVSPLHQARSRLVNRARHQQLGLAAPSDSALRLRLAGSSSQSRLACAVRYEDYLGAHERPGQGVFSNPQGSPQNFPVTPRERPVHPQRRHRDPPPVHSDTHSAGAPALT